MAPHTVPTVSSRTKQVVKRKCTNKICSIPISMQIKFTIITVKECKFST